MRDLASLETPNKWLAAPAQPGIHQPGLSVEPNFSIAAGLHESESESAAPGAESSRGIQQVRNNGFREVHEQSFRDPKSPSSGIEARFVQDRHVDLTGGEIGGDEVKSSGVDITRCLRFESLRCRMIDFPKARGLKLPMKRQGERIEARAKNDDLRDCVVQRFACEESQAFLSQRIMTQDSGDSVSFDELHYAKETWPVGQSKKQPSSRGMGPEKLRAEISGNPRPGARVLLVLIDHGHAGGNEQCRAAGALVVQRTSIRLRIGELENNFAAALSLRGVCYRGLRFGERVGLFHLRAQQPPLRHFEKWSKGL